MNRRFLIISSLISSAVVGLMLFTSAGKLVDTKSINTNGKWVHYAQRNATSEMDGVREYWIQCGGDYTLTNPQVSCEEASHYDTTGFATDDPRWIKYIKNDKAVFYDLNNSEINCCELGVSGYTTTDSHSDIPGQKVQATFKKDDSSCWYYGDFLTVTEVINDGNTLMNRIWMKNYTETFHGYYVLGQDMEGFTNDSTASIAQCNIPFAGTLDGRGHTVDNVVSSYQAGIFGTSVFYDSSYGFGYLKNITFTNFSSAAYGLIGYNCKHLHLENVSIYAKNNVYYLLGGSYIGAMEMKNCYFDISAPGTMRIFGGKSSPSTVQPTCQNVKINNDLSKKHSFFGDTTEKYDETGVIWTHPAIVTKENETLFYRLKNNTLCYSEISSDLEGYSFYDDYFGEKQINFSGKTAGSEQIVYALKENNPTYAIKCLVVTDAFESKAQFDSWSSSRTSDGDQGYYVLCCDFVYSNSNIMTGPHAFKGTFDGRGHTITYTLKWDSNYGLFGQITSGGTIKNLNVDGINKGYALGWTLWSGNIENCTFTAADTIERSNVALGFNSIKGTSTLTNVVFDNKEHTDTVIALDRGGAGESIDITFDNVKVKCLKASNMFNNVYDGKPVNPTEIKYEYYDGNMVDYSKGVSFTSTYKIKYVVGDTYISKAANILKQNINRYDDLGFDIALEGIYSTTSIASTTKSIIIGSTKSFTDAGFTMADYPDLNEAGYVIRTKDNAVYIMSVGYRGYQLAVNKFAQFLLGFDCLGLNAYVYSRDGSVIPYIRYGGDADVIDRKYDPYFNDYHADDAYSMNCNINANYLANFTSTVYTDTKGTTSKNTEGFHTAMLILPAPTYYSTHRTWYGIYNGTGVYADGYEKTVQTGALCYTARGNTSDYNLMVQTFGDSVIANCDTKNNYKINVGNSDGDGYCKCSECAKHNPSYNFVRFLNDVDEYIQGQGKSIRMSFLCYKAFLETPDDVNLKCNDNVVPFVAPIRANYYEPLNASVNSSYSTKIEQWAAISSECNAWIYDTNFSNLLYPFNSYKVTAQNIKYLASLGYSMVWPQGLYSTGNPGAMTGFTALKYYVESKFMEDADSDYDALVDNFFTYYYGKGGNKMRTMFDEITGFINTRYSETEKAIGGINDNAGDMNDNTQTGIPEHEYLYNWKYLDVVNWRTYCHQALALESDTEIKKRIRAERIFPNWSLSTLFASSMGDGDFSKTVHDELIKDCNELGVIKWKEGASIYNGGDNDINNYFANNNMYIQGETLIYNLYSQTLDYSNISSALDGYSFYANGNKTAIDWSKYTTGTEFVSFAMKDNSPTYMVRVICAYVVANADTFNNTLNLAVRGGSLGNYFVITNDIATLNVPDKTQSLTYKFSAQVDGLNHTIGTVNANTSGLLGTRVFNNGSNYGTLKNLNIGNVVGKDTQYLFGWHTANLKLNNVNVSTLSKEGPLLAGEYGAGNEFRNCTFDLGSAANATLYSYALTSSNYISYSNVTIKYRLDSQKLYNKKTTSISGAYVENRDEAGIRWLFI